MIWKINKKNISGIFIAVNVVDTVTNFGQVSLNVVLSSHCVSYSFLC